jgi:hypothetical protein
MYPISVTTATYRRAGTYIFRHIYSFSFGRSTHSLMLDDNDNDDGDVSVAHEPAQVDPQHIPELAQVF